MADETLRRLTLKSFATGGGLDMSSLYPDSTVLEAARAW